MLELFDHFARRLLGGQARSASAFDLRSSGLDTSHFVETACHAACEVVSSLRSI
ncbi:hypothetical protein EV184_101179 [Sinorhizobium americanum]|uniref:Uncharacterized protein n=1 Tax=Sinorhizobium americanum TaxID=194963 RepID=A0A4R2C8C7_9HYPH|nr:hypothetical protein EV184_101179 [Sinorhizobium americanum]